MSKKRGLSLEEKRTRMLELFFERKEFFLLKELEKIAPKEKGITSMSVKEVVQSLVDDNLVDTDKIGTSVYFWAYPSKAIHTDERNLILEELTQKEKLCKELEQELERYRECDPEVLENLQKETLMSKEGANRWTDNVFTIKSWCERKFGLEKKMIDKSFGIPEDFDYVE
ncbi:meiotic nuclear division protein 1 homolog isoform X2 [Pocillopora verrucosa]|uniref:meiotic nuclear division protein 1 homolog isoform X2 n=1 Tax=Pocillopora verrucosa TaxID=203993 RepID=UPI002797A802|nr:meiotic nuclear division protein 1 homolog isoform X2 [Pocillopora verrucosa]